MTESELRQAMVETAQRWLGKQKADGSFREIVDIYNAHRPLPRHYKLTYHDPWCAGTVSALAIVNDLTLIIPVECSCGYMIDGFRRLETWVEADDFVPQPGDVIFYDWQDSGGGDDRGSADHVGLVETVDHGRLSVIEGNRGEMVSRRVLMVGGRYIRGYGAPDYAGEAASRSLFELARLKVLNTPSLWQQKLVCGTIPHLGKLLCNAAAAIDGASQRTDTPAEGLERLSAAGVVNSPDYWMRMSRSDGNVAALLCALGGAVQV